MVFVSNNRIIATDVSGVRRWPQIYTILAVCLNSLTTGQMVGWTSPAIPQLTSADHPDSMSKEAASYLPIIPPITLILVSPIVSRLIDWIGRKYSLLPVTLSYCISWALTALGGPPWVYYLARVFNGIGDTCCFATIPCYVTEIATPNVRGTWGNCISLSIFMGTFLQNIIGAFLDIRSAALVSLALPGLFLVNFLMLPESPYYLITKGRMEEARKTLVWLRGPQQVDVELEQLKADVSRQLSETGRFRDLFLIKSNRRACLVGALVRFGQQYSGISAVTVYTQTIFIESGSGISASLQAIIFTGLLVVSTVLGSFFLERLGRRKAMLLSSTGTFIVQFIQSAFFYIDKKTDLRLEGFELFPLVSMVTFVFVYSVGLGLVPTLLLGELFSSSIKSKAYMLMNICFGFAIATSAKIFAVFLDYDGLYAGFLFLAAASFATIWVSYFIVPETKGKTLEEIQQQFKK